MRRSTLLILAAIVGLALAHQAFAQDKPKRGPRGDGPGALLRPNVLAEKLELTAEQKLQVETILQKARSDIAQATDPQAKRQTFQTAMDNISQNVLNDTQRRKFARLRQAMMQKGPGGEGPRPMAILRQLGLTEEQKARVQEILQQTRADMDKADQPQAKRQVHQAAMRKIRDTVLTDEQRQKFDELQAQIREEVGKQRRGHDQQRPGIGKHQDGQRKGPGKRGPASQPA